MATDPTNDDLRIVANAYRQEMLAGHGDQPDCSFKEQTSVRWPRRGLGWCQSVPKEFPMQKWLGRALEWGGAVLAMVSAAALIYVELFLMRTAEEAPVESTAPVELYWILLVIGVIAAIIGFFGRRRTSGGET